MPKQEQEYCPSENEQPITIADLLADNKSSEAAKRRAAYQNNYLQGKNIGIEHCADARVITPSPEFTDACDTIAAAGNKAIPEDGDPLIHSLMTMGHFDGETVRPGVQPSGCGGLLAKEEQLRELRNGALGGVAAFVEDRLYHPDVMVQTMISAAQRAERQPNKQVLAAMQDHLNGKIYPLALFRGRAMLSAVPTQLLLAGSYNPGEIYRSGIPFLASEDLPEQFRQYLALHAANMEQMNMRLPHLRERQKVQKPSVLKISTGRRPLAVNFPTIGDTPNQVFRLRLAAMTNGQVPKEAQREVLQEAEYPLTHFDTIQTILINTDSMDESHKFAQALLAQPWINPWRQHETNNLYIARTQEGILADHDTIKLR